MAHYILVESRDPFESRDVDHYYDLATRLVDKGDSVTLFLVQNGVLAVRSGAPGDPLAAVVNRNVTVLADAFSLRERGIGTEERRDAVREAEIDELVDLVLGDDNPKVLWH